MWEKPNTDGHHKFTPRMPRVSFLERNEQMSKIDLNKQAKEILEIAEKHGAPQNFFSLTTFKRYRVQIGILNDLEKTIREEETLVTKEYVKWRKNVYSHLAISDYNRTTDSANKTVVTLMKIITTLRDRQDDDESNHWFEPKRKGT